MTLQQIWNAFQNAHSHSISPFLPQPNRFDNPFLVNYVVYHHYRSLGWVIKGGIKFCVDYLLYKRGPVFHHAESVSTISHSTANTKQVLNWLIRPDFQSSFVLYMKTLRIKNHHRFICRTRAHSSGRGSVLSIVSTLKYKKWFCFPLPHPKAHINTLFDIKDTHPRICDDTCSISSLARCIIIPRLLGALLGTRSCIETVHTCSNARLIGPRIYIDKSSYNITRLQLQISGHIIVEWQHTFWQTGKSGLLDSGCFGGPPLLFSGKPMIPTILRLSHLPP